MASFNDGDGVWRTISGRRVFIRSGQSISSAMKASGKFKKSKRLTEEEKGARRTSKVINKLEKKDNLSEREQAWKDELKETREKLRSGMTKEERIKELESKAGGSKNEFTREELKAKYGTDNTDVINAGKEKGDRVSLKSEANIDNELKKYGVEVVTGKVSENKASRLKPGAEIYYKGDMANTPGNFVIESFNPEKEQYLTSITLKEKGGEGRTFKIGSNSIEDDYGKSPGSRFSFKEDYDNYRNKVYEQMAKKYAKNESDTSNNKTDKKEFHYAGEELYSDDPNRFGDTMRKYNEKMNPSVREPLDYRYRLLDRLRTDNEYYLGNGGRAKKHLWAGDEEKQINKMKEIYNSFKENERPNWLTEKDIDEYAKKMGVKTNSNNNGDWLRNAYNEYKKQHPNTKMSFNTFKKNNQ